MSAISLNGVDPATARGMGSSLMQFRNQRRAPGQYAVPGLMKVMRLSWALTVNLAACVADHR
ncbi:hypothetical protein [Marinobacter sp. C18]|uniref:hypothetical protein n=1 Tax=Marinobacter sp. C18 TaxID=1772288 RepID=UPI000B058F3E|nr:hypothetical protein [Marinobacter sp. C18]